MHDNLTMPVLPKDTCSKYFKQIDISAGTWKCKCGKVLVQKKNTGWSNLLNHVKRQHPEESANAVNNTPSVINAFAVDETSRKGRNIYGWIRIICDGMRPFSFVEDTTIREYIRLESISENTLRKYMGILTKEVEKKISHILPEKIALVIDGWTKASVHFVGVFATYPDLGKVGGYESVMLAFSPMFCETEFGADEHYEFISWVLSVYGKTFENVIAIIGDNVSVNKALSTKCNLPLIGCASHRFNLAVKEHLKPQCAILEKINNLMGKLKSLKLSGKLRLHTDLRPVQRNDTRWSSTYAMVERYGKFREILSQPEFSREKLIIDFIPTPRENADIAELEKNWQSLMAFRKLYKEMM